MEEYIIKIVNKKIEYLDFIKVA